MSIFAPSKALKHKTMTTRREKAKPQKPQLNKQLEAANKEEPKPKVNTGMWKENLGKYLIDISKYVVTGVMITSIFKDIEDQIFIYVFAFFLAIPALIVGLVLTNKKKGN